ncbi:MAG: hypothetical protein AAF990_05650 [Bacteroidota bacterium]
MSKSDFIDFINQLFASLDSTDSTVLLIFLLGAFLIGWVFCWLSNRRTLNRLRQSLKQKTGSLITTKANYDALQAQFGQKDSELESFRTETTHSKKNMDELELEKAQLQTSIYQLEEQLSKAQSELSVYHEYAESNGEEETEFTRADYIRLTVDLERLQLERESLISRNEQLDAENEALRLQVRQNGQGSVIFDSNGQGEDLDEIRQGFHQQANQLSSLESKLSRLENDNRLLKESVQESQEDGEEEVEVLIGQSNEQVIQAREAIAKALGTQLDAANASEKDNLQQIDGIGPFIEGQLNEIGLYTFKQISQLDQPLIEQLTNAIRFFPGRIQKDDWVGQARRLRK